MVTPISGPTGSSGSNVAVLSTVILLNPEDLTKPPDTQAKEEAPPPTPVEASSVSISAQAARQSQESSKPSASADAAPAKPASTSAAGSAASAASNTLAVDISYAAADTDQNGVVSDAEQAAYELKHPEVMAAKNSDAPLSRTSSEALKAYETISAAGTET